MLTSMVKMTGVMAGLDNTMVKKALRQLSSRVERVVKVEGGVVEWS